MPRFNNLRIRNKLTLIVSGTVVVLTVGMLAALYISAKKQVEADVHDELRAALGSFMKSEQESMDANVLQADTLSDSVPMARWIAKRDRPAACAWEQSLLSANKSQRPPESSFDIVGLILPGGRPLAIAVRGQPCQPANAAWPLPPPMHLGKPAIANWDSPTDQFYQLVEMPMTIGGDDGVLILGSRVSPSFAAHIKDHTGQKIEIALWHMDGAELHQLGASAPFVQQVISNTFKAGKLLPKRSASSATPPDKIFDATSARQDGYSILDANIGYRSAFDYNPEGLHISLVQSLSQKYAPYYAMARTMVSIALLTMLLGITAGLLLSAPIADPLVRLAAMAESVAKGDLDVAHQLAGRPSRRMDARDEVGVLGRSFLRMIQGLKERLAMSAYLSQATIEHVRLGAVGGASSGIQRTSMVVLFSDIRNFTDFSESEDPARVIELLNQVLSLQTRVVERNGGDINKFIGDAVFAWFVGDDRCQRAIDAANEIVAELRQVFAGKAATMVGIGIHLGEVVVGSVGSPDRKDYTAIGGVVNIAARLCSSALRGQVLVSAAVAAELQAAEDSAAAPRTILKPLAPIHLKGIAQPVAIYQANQPEDLADNQLSVDAALPSPAPS